MKKLKNQTGLVKGEPAGKNARKTDKASSQKVSNKKAARQRKTAKLQQKRAEKAPAKKRKQGGKGRPYQPKPWEAYAPKGPNAASYTREELEKIVRRASGAANRRLKRLEEAGETKGAYKRAKGMLATQGRDKFSGAVKSMNKSQLIAEYLRLRDFMTAKTSTAQGVREWKKNVYESLRDRGFEGSPEELSELFDKYMVKELENALGSDVVYTLLQSEDGRPFLQRAKDALDNASKNGIDQKAALAREFNISTERQASQILAKYFGGL